MSKGESRHCHINGKSPHYSFLLLCSIGFVKRVAFMVFYASVPCNAGHKSSAAKLGDFSD